MSTEATGRRLNEQEKRKFDFGSWTIIYLTAALFLFLSATRSTFLGFNNIHSIFFDVSVDFFAIIGFTFLIIMGELDMSVGSMFCFGGTMMGIFCNTYKLQAAPAILLAMVIAGVIGLVSGFLITRFRLNSMMVTIGVMLAVKGYNWMMITKMTGRQLPRDSRNFVMNKIGGISWVIILMLITAVILEFLLIKSRYFKQMYYVGHNMDTTVLYGIKADRLKMVCFMVSAMLSTFGGALMTCRVKAPNVTVGSDLEVTMITAAVIGGASIFGGKGSMIKSMLGLVMGCINGYLVSILGINALIATLGMQYVGYGAAMLLWNEVRTLQAFDDAYIILGDGEFAGMYVMTWVLLLLIVLFSLFLKYFPQGKRLYFVGGNKEAAKLIGFHDKRILFLAYAATGVLTSLAAVFRSAYVHKPTQYMGEGIHMTCFIACVIGGGSFAGGKGSAAGAVLGVIFMSLLTNTFNLLKMSPELQNIVVGVILVLVVTLDGYRNIKKLREQGKI